MLPVVPSLSGHLYFRDTVHLITGLVGLCVVSVTGASFVVFNGALKASSGFIAKSSIVEGKVADLLTLILHRLTDSD